MEEKERNVKRKGEDGERKNEANSMKMNKVKSEENKNLDNSREKKKKCDWDDIWEVYSIMSDKFLEIGKLQDRGEHLEAMEVKTVVGLYAARTDELLQKYYKEIETKKRTEI